MSEATVPAAAPQQAAKPPAWLQSMLYSAAEHIAAKWQPQASAIEFKPFAGTDEAATFLASVVCEPAATEFRLYVHHKASGRFVCRSMPVVMDAIDGDTWNTDLESGDRP